MLILGSVLITASESDIKTWDAVAVCEGGDAVPVATVTLPPSLRLTTLCHPPTYINKVVVGGEGGELLVVNVSSCKILFSSSACGGVGVTALESSPAVDVIAVGLADGRILLHNIKLDKVCVCVCCVACLAAVWAGLTLACPRL